MQERFLFEYAVIRFVPKVEREEFLNVGVILLCREKNFLYALISNDEEKIRSISKETEIDLLATHLIAFQNIAKGSENSGIIGGYDISSRFRWLTATRSTIVQCSKVHPGFCEEPVDTLNNLYRQLVL